MGQKAHLASREDLGGPLKRGGKSLQAFPVSQEGSGVPQKGREGLGGPPERLGGVERPSQRVWKSQESPQEGW